MKVLIVDDNSDDRRLLKLNLEHHGCKVIEASDGMEGLAMAKAHRPGLIVSDALMPVMDGFQFLRRVKTDESLKSIPFVFFSAVYSGYKEAELAISLGAETFIIKPQDPEEFWNELQGILENCRLKKPKGLTAGLIEEEEEFLMKYSHIVAAKLEEKVRELEKAKAAVEAKEQEWRETFESIGDCISIHDRNFNVLLANKSCEKFLGASHDEIRSRKCFELFHGKTGPHEACPKLNTEQTGNPFEAEIFEPKLNYWLSITCFPLLDKDGAVRGVVHIARDITQRKRMEEALQHAKEFAENLIQSANVIFVQLDSSGNVRRINETAEKITGYSQADVLGRNWFEILVPKNRYPHVWEEFGRITQRGEISEIFENPVLTKSGEERQIIWKNKQLCEGDKVIGTISFGIDITERKGLESQLRQAQKMEAVGQLAGGIAHDFNNIMSAIINYAYLIKNILPKDDPLCAQIDQISSLSMKASEITRGLLAFSRKNIVNLLPVHINNVLLDMGKLLSKFIGEDIEINFRLSDKDLIVMADSSHIEQVIINLATNARDAMPEGGSLTIETDMVSIDHDFIHMHGFGKRGTYALLTVTDTGIGMDEETKQRIFEPFFTTKEAGKGTGLGLAIIYGIVKQHEGHINVYSEPGMGTTFRIYLPVVKAAVPEKEETKPSDLTGHAETILLAEDEAAVRNSVKIVLEQFGYKVIEAVNGDDAIEKFREHKDIIDLLVLDVIMPKKSGKEAYEEIKKIRPGTKVIFTSGYSADVIDKRGIITDGFIHILKPLSPDKLLSTIKEALQNG